MGGLTVSFISWALIPYVHDPIEISAGLEMSSWCCEQKKVKKGESRNDVVDCLLSGVGKSFCHPNLTGIRPTTLVGAKAALDH